MLTIFKGDDTGGTVGKVISIRVDSDIPLADYVLTFSYCGVTRTFTNLVSGDTIEILFTHAETSTFPIGVNLATITITDDSGRIRTLANTLRIKVTENIAECYGVSSSQTQIHIKISVSWNNITGKPTTFPPSVHSHTWGQVAKPFTQDNVFDMECEDWAFRKIVADVFSQLGGKVINND